MGKWIEFRKIQIAEEKDKGVSACHLSVTSNTDSYDTRDTRDAADFLPSVSVVSAFENIDDLNKKIGDEKSPKLLTESSISSSNRDHVLSNSQIENEMKNHIQSDDAETIHRISTNSSAKEHLHHLLKIGWRKNSVLINEFKKKHNL